MTDEQRAALRELIGVLLRPHSVYMGGYWSGLQRSEQRRVDSTIDAILAAIEPAIRADEREAWERELSAVMPADFKDWHQNDRSEWPMIAAAVIRHAREREEIVASRAERAEAEVTRLRGLLRHAGVALWETGVDHPVLQDIDDALPPGWAAQARKDTP